LSKKPTLLQQASLIIYVFFALWEYEILPLPRVCLNSKEVFADFLYDVFTQIFGQNYRYFPDFRIFFLHIEAWKLRLRH
jgi:hypothetical protein